MKFQKITLYPQIFFFKIKIWNVFSSYFLNFVNRVNSLKNKTWYMPCLFQECNWRQISIFWNQNWNYFFLLTDLNFIKQVNCLKKTIWLTHAMFVKQIQLTSVRKFFKIKTGFVCFSHGLNLIESINYLKKKIWLTHAMFV